MKNYALIVLLLCFTCAHSQKVPKSTKQQFTNCYTGKSAASSKFLISGFYREIHLSKYGQGETGKDRIESDSFTMDMIFYEDGTVLYNLVTHSTKMQNSSNPFITTQQQVIEYLSKANQEPEKYKYYLQPHWGIYRIANDTLIIQYIHRKASLNDSWYAWELKYKILDNTTIVYLPNQTKALHKHNEQDIETFAKAQRARKFLPAHLIPCSAIPPPDCWLKKETWLQCKEKMQ